MKDLVLARLTSFLRSLSLLGAFGSSLGLAQGLSQAQSADRAVLTGTVLDATGAVIRGAAAYLMPADAAPGAAALERDTDTSGDFSFSPVPGRYVLKVEAPGFAPYTSQPLTLRSNGKVRLPIHLLVAGHHEEISVGDGTDGATDPNSLADAIVFEGESLNLLSSDPATLRQQLNALAGGFGTPSYLIDGFSGGRLPSKATIRSIRINNNPFSAYFSDFGLGRVEINTKPGTEQFHGMLTISGTDQPLDARNPYSPVEPPFYDFEQDANLTGPLGKNTSFLLADTLENLANASVVNAADPANPSALLSGTVPSPLRTETFSLRVDRQFTPRNFGYLRDEWSQTHVANSGINPLVLPAAAFSLNTLTNTLQAADTEQLSAHAVNEVRFQYLRSRVRRDPNSTSPSIVVEGAFQQGGNPDQVLRDNQDAFEVQDLFDFDRGKHAFRVGLRLRTLRDANQSSAGFNGQYIFPDAASYLAGAPTQYSQTTGQQGAVLSTVDLGIFAEDDWKLTRNLTLSYGLRFESQTAIPDHSDPAPRVGFAWAVRPGKRKTPIVNIRGGYGIFYDRFPAAQLLQAVRQNGVREIAFVQKNPGFNASGPPPGATLTAAQPSIYQVDPQMRTSYGQAGSLRVSRSLGRFGTLSGNLLYLHNTHNYLTRNSNAPLPGTFDPANPASGLRPLGTDANIYQFASRANGNEEHAFLNYRVQLGARLSGFGVLDTGKNYNETDGITSYASNQYDLRQDYGRSALHRAVSYTGGLQWTLPYGAVLTPFLVAHTGAPFNLTTGTDSNGDTIYNDRPALPADPLRSSVVSTVLGSYDVSPTAGERLVARNAGTAPGYFWLQLRAEKNFQVGPRPAAAVASRAGQPPPSPDRPWTLNFGVEVHNLTNHTNPGLPVGVISAQPCGTASTASCSCPATSGSGCGLAPSAYFGHSLSLAPDFSPISASNRTILLQTSFTF